MMKQSVIFCVAVAMLLAPISLTGCETYGQAGGLGAGLGAAAGAVIGNQSGHALEGAAIGALVGGAAGLIAHDVKARRERTREETVQTYGYTPTQGLMLQFERAEILPNNARPGERIQSTIQYALLGAGAGISVREERSLLQGDRVLGQVSSETFTREDGTWVSSQELQIPNNMGPGIYSVDTRVTAGNSVISGRANFSVQ